LASLLEVAGLYMYNVLLIQIVHQYKLIMKLYPSYLMPKVRHSCTYYWKKNESIWGWLF